MERREKKDVPKLPEMFMQRMKKLLGEEYPLFEESYLQERVQGLRLNGQKGNLAQIERDCRAHFKLEAIPWAEYGFYYEKEEKPGKHPYHEAGLYYIQEPSAMAVVEALDPKPGDKVLDLCAAPGGKSTQIVSRLQGKGFLVSNEIHPARAKILSQNMERIGAANGIVTNHDAQTLAGWLPEFFDKIVVDAPCSGEGMFRKEADARKEWTPDSPRQCSLRQREILDFAASMLKPGGLMVYSTCTFAPEENEETVEVFLQNHPEFCIEQKQLFPGFGKGQPQWSLCGGREELAYTFRLWPHQLKGEGHYLAILRKEGEESVCGRKKTSGWNAAGKCRKKEEMEVFYQFCRDTFCSGDGKIPGQSGNLCGSQPENYLFFGEQLYYVSPELPNITGKKVLRPGLHLGTFKKNRFEPSHALALYLHREQVKSWINLDSRGEQIIRYLKGDALSAKEPAGGWVLVTVDGYSLGWAKMANERLQNHYPKGLRWL